MSYGVAESELLTEDRVLRRVQVMMHTLPESLRDI